MKEAKEKQPLAVDESGFLRIHQIIGKKSKSGEVIIRPIIPVSRSVWWAGVKSGKFPAPVKISNRTTAWRIEDIRRLIESLSA